MYSKTQYTTDWLNKGLPRYGDLNHRKYEGAMLCRKRRSSTLKNRRSNVKIDT
jgi:hypothetical protein